MQTDPNNLPEPDELDQLIWGLLDETIDPKELEALQDNLQSSKEARERYISCCSLHTSLIAEFGKKTDHNTPTESPVLESLGGIFPGIDDRPPVA